MVTAEIGILGGSGFYELAEGLTEKRVHTPYGSPSAPVALGEMAGRRVAFLPRHGKHHEFPAHIVNYRANMWALRDLGVTRVLAPCASGSLQSHIHPGDAVVCDQLVDRTSGRAHTFHDGPHAVHISFADPYCPEVRAAWLKAAPGAGLNVHDGGTVVVIQGPRFSTRAESIWFSRSGWDIVNMTQYPEAYLARELEMCYATLALVTDYDSGPRDDPGRSTDGPEDRVAPQPAAPVSMDEVFRVFSENLGKLRTAVVDAVRSLPTERNCDCGRALSGTALRVSE